jgi:galactoside 2-L-fucosyltransferase 1/2
VFLKLAFVYSFTMIVCSFTSLRTHLVVVPRSPPTPQQIEPKPPTYEDKLRNFTDGELFPVESEVLLGRMPANGRLGNELFLFASVYGLSRRYNRVAALPKGRKIFQHFNVSVLRVPHTQNSKHTRKEKSCNKHDVSLEAFVKRQNQSIALVGYLQSFKYFLEYSDEIRRDLRCSESHRRSVDENLAQPKKQYGDNITLIGVHIRRGDMATEGAASGGYTVAPKEYLDHAVNFYQELLRGQNLSFIVASDDYKWSKENFDPHGSHLAFADVWKKDAMADLCLLASCDHSIMTVGTFGWWGSFLAGGKVVYYKDYPLKGTFLWRHFERKDYFPGDWVGLR